MRAPVVMYVVAVAFVAAIAGCGDSNDTTVILGDEPSPADATHTATPVRTPTPVATATTLAQTPTAVATPTTGAATPSITATAGSTPVPTATPSGGVDADVQRIAADILPFLTNTALLTGGSTSALVEALKNDPCPDGGSRVDDEGFPAHTLTFNACDVSDQLGSFEFDGQVVVTLSSFGGGTIVFDFTLTDRSANHAVHFAGTLTLTVASGGFVLDGPLTVSTPEGNFTLNNHQVTVNANRKIVSGSGMITDDNDNFDLQMVAFAVTGGGAASNLTVTFDDSSVHTYTLDLATGELTQKS
jgi:hypothetical protein